MGFRLRQGPTALVTLCVLVACNTYTPELLTPAETESTSDSSDTSDSTQSTGSGGSSGNITTTINTVTSTSATTSGGDGGSGSGTTASPNETTTGSGGSGGDSSTGSTNTETEATTTGTTGGGGSDGSGGSGGSGGGGGGGTGGVGGIGGSSGEIDVLLIDDLEDGNNQLETPTYSGYWFTTANEDGEGSLVPAPDDECEPEDLETPRGDSERAMHVSGSWTGTDLEWIAAFGFALQHDEMPVDASNYAGVTFYAKTDDTDTQAHLQVMITDVKDEGHFAIELELTSSWEQYTVLWNDQRLIQPSWAADVMFDAANLFKLQFQFDTESFDLWVDDIRFVEP